MNKTNHSPFLPTFLRQRSVACLILVVLGIGCSKADEGKELPVTVDPKNSLIRYEGRFDFRDPQGPRFTWPGSSIQAKFTGSSVNAILSGNQNRMEVIIDGQPTAVLSLQPNPTTYRVADNLSPNGPHTIELFHRTETFVGTAQFLGLQLAEGGALQEMPPASGRRIEFIGDSITCGYGDEAASEREHFSPETENHYLAYGPLTARGLGADFITIAWSGAWLSDKAPPGSEVIPKVYGRTLGDRAKNPWTFSSWIPQVVVINLGTNDFSSAAPEESDWVNQYEAFVEKIYGNYPAASIFLCTGPMLGDEQALPWRKAVQAVVDGERHKGFSRTYAVEFPVQKYEDGYGADYHPSLKTQQKMADQLSAVIRQQIGW